MLKIQEFAVLILLFCCISSKIFSQRNVFFIHGFSGSENSWRDIAGYLTSSFNIRNISNHTYDTDNGVQGFVNSFNSPSYNNGSLLAQQTNDFAICHSMGGIMMRNFDLDPNNIGKIGGIITVGSPLNGAQLANSYNDLTLRNFLDNGYYQLSKGIKKDGFIQIASAFSTDLKQLFNGVEAFKYDNFVNSSGFRLSQTTINDLLTNSNNVIRTDNNKAATATKKLSIYGSEADPAFWRLIGSANYSDNPDSGVIIKNKLADAYRMLKDFAENNFLYSLLLQDDKYYYAQLFADAADWVDNISSPGWQRVIGAGDFERQSLCFTSKTINWNELSACINQNTNNYPAFQNCVNQHSYSVTTCYTPFANAASDGVGPASSQVGQYSTSWSNAEDPVKVNVLNHVDEPANNQKMRDAFTSIFNKPNSFFQIQ